jgi:catechol 2,3-dioxygenase-like lactoylglutathione lyase family enzyme
MALWKRCRLFNAIASTNGLAESGIVTTTSGIGAARRKYAPPLPASERPVELNQVTIPCIAYEASVSFYKTLGFRQIVDSPPRYARFETKNGTTFSVHSAEGPGNPDYVIYFEVDDVDAVVGQLKSKGLVFDLEPRDQSWLWREAYLHDPAGNRICIYHAGQYRRFPPWRTRTENE